MKGSEIKEGRTRLKLTQKKLAEELGVDIKTIINWEQGGVIPKTRIPSLKSFFSSKEEINLEDLIYNRIESKFKNRLDKIDKVQATLQENFVKLFKMVMTSHSELDSTTKKSSNQ